MTREYKLLINGKLVRGHETAPVINPATEQPFAESPVASHEQLDQAVAAAKAAQVHWAETSTDERRKVLGLIADRIETNVEDIARVLTLEQGKTLRDSKGEIALLVATIRHFCTLNLDVEVIEEDDTHRVELHYRPFGVRGGDRALELPPGPDRQQAAARASRRQYADHQAGIIDAAVHIADRRGDR